MIKIVVFRCLIHCIEQNELLSPVAVAARSTGMAR